MSAGIPGRAIFIIKNYRKDNKLLNFYSCRGQKFFYWAFDKEYQTEKYKSAVNLMLRLGQYLPERIFGQQS